MELTDIASAGELRWIADRWWRRRWELRQDGQVVAWLQQTGEGCGIAGVGDRRYTVSKVRVPFFITLHDAMDDELIARLALSPDKGLLAEFRDGDSFRLGWVGWLRAEWEWTDEAGRTVLKSRYSWFRSTSVVRVDPDYTWLRKWPLLAILEASSSKLRIAAL